MKTYRVVLRSLGMVFVEADSVVQSGERVSFYRDGITSPCAEWELSMVKHYEATAMPPLRFPKGQREDSQCP